MENKLEPSQNSSPETTPAPEIETPQNLAPETRQTLSIETLAESAAEVRQLSLTEVLPETAQTPPALESPATEPKKDGQISIKIDKRKAAIAIAIVAGIIVIGAIVYSVMGLVVAATVGWSPISRYSVIRELEKTYGKSVLTSLITQKLIDSEAVKQGIIVSEEDVNAEIADIEKQLSNQGQTLEQALEMGGMTLDDLKKRIIDQKKMEKLVAGQMQVSDGEVDQYIKDNDIHISKDQEAEYKSQLKEQLEQQKLNEAASALIDSLKTQAKIRYFTNY